MVGRARPIYLDYHATTPTDPRVAAVVLHHLTTAFGNASSADHAFGDEAEAAVEAARAEVAALVNAPPAAVVFTSGATESLNLALQGFTAALARAGHRPRLAVSPVEHRAVLDTCAHLAREGRAELRWLRVDDRARLDLDHVEDVCRAGVDLVVAMAANNEVGTLYPVDAVGALAEAHGAAFLCDATQAAGKVPLLATRSGVTFLALSAHKFYGPKGAGALVVRRGAPLEAALRGGGHERGLRSGTLNVPGIAGLGEAARLRRAEMAADEPAIARRRDTMEATLLDAIPGLVVNGDRAARLAGNLHVSVPDVPNGAVVARLRERVALATGAACSSGVEAPSHVLRAMRLPQPIQDGALRLSLGKFTTDEDVSRAAAALAEAVHAARSAIGRALA